MPSRDIVVIGGSSGGLEALSEVLRLLPGDLPASLFVVIHFPSEGKSLLPNILSKVTSMTVSTAVDQAKFRQGEIYVAPPNHHLVLDGDRMRLLKGPKVNRFRPAIDPLFQSAAHHFRDRTTGVLLTGALDDGVFGLLTIQSMGGATVVQDPHQAIVPDLPRNALAHLDVDHCLPSPAIGPLLISLAHGKNGSRKARGTPGRKGKAMKEKDVKDRNQASGPLMDFTCPDCNGPIRENSEGSLVRYQCLIGHSYASESFDRAQSERLERALDEAIKCLEERVKLLNRLSENAAKGNDPGSSKHYRKKAQEKERHVRLLQQATDGAKD